MCALQGYVAPEVVRGSQKYVCSSCFMPSSVRDVLQVVEDHTYPTVAEAAYDNDNADIVQQQQKEEHHTGVKRKRIYSSVKSGESVKLDRKARIGCIPFHNVVYEQTYGVPEYDRDGSSAERIKLLGMPSSTATVSNAIKSRCFNCGSYSHSIKECWKQHDADQIDARRREYFSSKPSSILLHAGEDKRYFSTTGASTKEQGDTVDTASLSFVNPHEPAPASSAAAAAAVREERNPGEKYPHVKPGLLSLRAKEALGMGPGDPPPWLRQMQRLGVSPAYQVDALLGSTILSHERQVSSKVQQDNDEDQEEGQIQEDDGNEDFIPCPVHTRSGGVIEINQKARVWWFPGVNCPPPPGSNLRQWGWAREISTLE